MNVLIIFVKAPVAGQVKTRLVPAISFEQAADLYCAWARSIYAKVSAQVAAQVRVAYAEDPLFPNPDWLSPGKPVTFFKQRGADLGERLKYAFEQGFKSGAKQVAVMGSDSPDLPVQYAQQAFAALENHDLALGPTQDGGYYLLGLKNKVVPELFENIHWSTDKVLRQTLAAAEQLNLKTHLLPQHYDIDLPEDLKKLGD